MPKYTYLTSWLIDFIRRHARWLIIIIALFAFATRMYRITLPSDYMFDEVYHALTAKLISRGDVRAFEWWNPPVEPDTAVDWLHPPFAKYTQAISMLMLGENALGWRMSSVVFGVLVILVTALLAQELFDEPVIAVVAAGLASLDGLLLAQSRIAMNDIHVTFFILASLLCYLRYQRTPQLSKILLTGSMIGLALASKWSGLFILAVIGGLEGWHLFWQGINLWRLKKSWKSWRKKATITVLALGVIPLGIYVGSYGPMFAQGKTLWCRGDHIMQGQCYCSQTSSWWVSSLSWVHPNSRTFWESLERRGGCKRLISHFSELHHQIWTYQTTLKATHPYQSRPWQWWLNLRPVWFHVDYIDRDHIGTIYNTGNVALFWWGNAALIGAIIWLMSRGKQLLHPTQTDAHLLLLLMVYGAVWLPWTVSPRIMFFYHYAPAVPLLSIILAWVIWHTWSYKPTMLKSTQLTATTETTNRQLLGRGLVLCCVISIILVFIVWYPNWVGIPVHPDYAQRFFFPLATWK